MKSKKVIFAFRTFAMLLMLAFFQTAAWAQDKSVDINITKDGGGGNWYAQPWVWIVGGAVFLLLLVALLRNNNSK